MGKVILLIIINVWSIIGSIYFMYMFVKLLYLKIMCKHTIEATIIDMTLTRGHRGGKWYLPTYNYTYNGQTYSIKGKNGFVYAPNIIDEKVGTKVTIKIDENKPTRVYDSLGFLCFLYFMLLQLTLAMFIISIYSFSVL